MQSSYRANLQVQIVCQQTGDVVDVPEEYVCTTYPEPFTWDHPVLLSTRIRQMAELRFLQHFIQHLVDESKSWQPSWKMEVQQFTYY